MTEHGSSKLGLPRQRGLLASYIVLAATAFIVNYPGRATPDALDMLWQARNVTALTDWHSPFVTFVYGFFAPVTGSPSGALLVQCALLMSWPAIILWNILSDRRTYPVTACLFILWSFVLFTFIAMSGEIVKDILELSFLSAIFFLFEARRKRISLARTDSQFAAWLTVCAVGATLVRPTNLIVLFICVAAFLLLTRGPPRHAHASIKAYILLALAVAAVPGSRLILNAGKSAPENPPIVFDLAGISTQTRIDTFASLADGASLPSARPWECYTPQRDDSFFWGKCEDYGRFVARHEKQLHRLWIKTVLGHPLAYLAHRWEFAKQFLLLDQPQTFVPPPPRFSGNATNYGPQIQFVPEKLRSGVQMWAPTIAYSPFGLIAYVMFHSWLGQPLLWVAILIAAGVVAYRRRRRGFAMYLALLSTLGLSNVVVMIFVTAADDMRYLLPTWMCAVGAAATMAAMLLRSPVWLRRPGLMPARLLAMPRSQHDVRQNQAPN